MYGVARVLATESVLDEHGRHPRAIVWCVYGGYLIRCAPEQLQYASERQKMLAEMDQPVELPWTFDKLTERLLPGSFLDVVPEAPDAPESDEDREAPLIKRKRALHKRPPRPEELHLQDAAPLLRQAVPLVPRQDAVPLVPETTGTLPPAAPEVGLRDPTASSSSAAPRVRSRSPLASVRVKEEIERIEGRISSCMLTARRPCKRAKNCAFELEIEYDKSSLCILVLCCVAAETSARRGL